MILYNITINIDYDCHLKWLKWMKDKHIPDVLNTGLFLNAKICRIHAEEQGGISYSVQYLLKNKSDYENYQKTSSSLTNKYVSYKLVQSACC